MASLAARSWPRGEFCSQDLWRPHHSQRQYYTAICDRDLAKAYSYPSSDLQASISLQAFTQAAQQQDEVFGKIPHYTYGVVP